MANEVVEEDRRKRKSCLILKVDYEKANDVVCWSLLYMLRGFEFNKRNRFFGLKHPRRVTIYLFW